MFTLKVENKNKQILELTQNEENYQVVHVDGLNPPEAEIYTNAVAGMDGEKFKSTKLQMRNLVLTIKINGDVEANRLHLYEYFRTGAWCKIYYSNDSRSVFIEGYVETIENDLFTISQEMQVSIVCPDPYLKSLMTIYADISKVFGMFEFPFDISAEGIEFAGIEPDREVVVINAGEIETGLLITLTASETVQTPIIYNVGTGEFIKLNITMQAGDVILIDTNKGHKTIKKISGAITTNVINSFDSGSSWLQLNTGVNVFTYTATEGAELLKVEMEANLLYEGV